MSFPTQAVIFLTHRRDEAVLRHFLRLRAETAALLPAFLCLHDETGGDAGDGFPADFFVQLDEAARVLPARHAAFRRGTGPPNFGYADLLAFPVFLRPRLAPFAFLWLIEYDVDYAGHWSAFFSSTLSSRADFLGTTIYPREQCPEWFHWRWFSAPPQVPPEAHLRSFLPIARFSRRMLERYATSVRDERWQGHFEALYPTVARWLGLDIQDLGGTGPYCPAEWLSRHYSNSPRRTTLSPGTFVFRPSRSDTYYHDSPERFSEAGYLYHPIKVQRASAGPGAAPAGAK